MRAPSLSVLLVAVALTAPLTACVRTNAVQLGVTSQAHPAVAADQVRIYRTAEQVPGKYEEVALLNSTGATGWTDEAKMFRSMQKKAGEMGANGLILDPISEPSAGAKVAGMFLGTGTARKGKAIGIYVMPAESTGVAAGR